jgi:hypothetical protein
MQHHLQRCRLSLARQRSHIRLEPFSAVVADHQQFLSGPQAGPLDQLTIGGDASDVSRVCFGSRCIVDIRSQDSAQGSLTIQTRIVHTREIVPALFERALQSAPGSLSVLAIARAEV